MEGHHSQVPPGILGLTREPQNARTGTEGTGLLAAIALFCVYCPLQHGGVTWCNTKVIKKGGFNACSKAKRPED